MKKKPILLFIIALALSFICFAPASASAEEITKVTVRTEPSNPVVMSKFSDVGVVVSSNNGYVAAFSWLDSAGNLDTDNVDNCVYTFVVRVTPFEGNTFAANVEGAINNSSVAVTRAEDGSYIEMSRIIEPALEAPTIWWSPTSETVDEGGLASFAATASPYYNKLQWNLISPTGSTTEISTITSKFSGVTYTEDPDRGRLNIHNVPVEMDGWQVSCTFSGPGGSATTSKAKINVKGAVVATPTPTATPEPPENPQDATDTPVTDAHEHSFSATWSFDEGGHWHACDCGEKGDYAEHSFQWTVTKEATKRKAGEESGVCSVCGYTTQRATEYQKVAGDNSLLLRVLLYIAVAVVLVVLLLIIFQSLGGRNARRRRRRRNNRRY